MAVVVPLPTRARTGSALQKSKSNIVEAHIEKKWVLWSVVQQFSHRHVGVHATGRLPRQWHAAADQTMHQSGATERRVLATLRTSALIMWTVFYALLLTLLDSRLNGNYWTFCGDFIFVAVHCTVCGKIVAGFTRCKHIKQYVVGCASVFCFKSP